MDILGLFWTMKHLDISSICKLLVSEKKNSTEGCVC